MAASSLLASSTSHLCILTLNPNPKSQYLHFQNHNPKPLAISIRRRGLAVAASISDEWGEKSPPDPEAPSQPDPPKQEDEWGPDDASSSASGVVVPDEWGEPSAPEPEATSAADPVADDDEWGKGISPDPPASGGGGGGDEKLEELKRCLVDSVYGTQLGFTASAEVRAEVLELVNQIEAANPTPKPVEAAALLDGNWILLYTAFSEFLPLIAFGTTPLLKVKKISQAIDTKSMTIETAITLSTPFASFSFNASASFEVRTSSRIQVQFKEGSFQPPDISSTVDLPEQVDIFGQKISLRPVQQTLAPIQQAVANIARTISGQPPLRVRIPGNMAETFLLTTYLDQDFRISRDDEGMFVLAKEGSPLLDLL